jgi:hypothetical protein
MSSLRRRYTDGPTESQKLYGSDLPPSLRWGAARKHTGSHGPGAVPRPEGYSNGAVEGFPPIPGYAASTGSGVYRGRSDRLGADLADELAEMHVERRIRTHSHDRTDRRKADLADELTEMRLERRMRSRSRGRSEPYRHDLGRRDYYFSDARSIERERRPFAGWTSTDKPFLLRNTAEGTSSDEQTDADENLSHASGSLAVPETGSIDEWERVSAIFGRDDVYGSEHLRSNGVADDVERNSGSRKRLSAEGGAERYEYLSDSDRIKHRHDHSGWEGRPSSSRPRPRRRAIDVSEHSTRSRRRRSQPYRSESNSSGNSHSTWVSRDTKSWFFQSWSVKPAKGFITQDLGSDQTSTLSPAIVTELSDESRPKVEAAPAMPSPFQRVRSWRYNQVLPTVEPTLKRIVHATYGDLLQSEALKGPNPPGFIAVPQSCSSQGDTLYHILWVRSTRII